MTHTAEGILRMGARNRLTWAGILLSGGLAAGCVPALPQPQDADAVDGLLSKLILQPYVTCEQLKSGLGLDFLPDVSDPSGADLRYEESWIVTPDYELLRTWYLPTRLQRGTIVLSMGAAGDVACYLFIAKLLAGNGWSVVMYDNRGFGLSTGSPSLNALGPDLEQVVDWARARTGREQVTVLGISLGTIPAVSVAARRPDAVNALILDSPVAMGEEIKRFSGLLAGLTQAMLASINPELLPEERIRDVRAPVLIYLHEDDIVTPPATIETIFNNATSLKTLIRFPGLPHVASPYYRTAQYTYYLETFLTPIWDPAARPPQ